MRKVRISPGEYYHVYNRGMSKQKIFFDRRDYVRFLFLLLHFQSSVTLTNVGRYTSSYVQHSVFNISEETKRKIIATNNINLQAFCLMPNHFHILVQEKNEGGIAQYMQRTLNAYTKYFNERRDSSGHLFQGPYQAVHVESNEQLLYLSAYIHRNPREINGWKEKEHTYPWSSYQDYVAPNRWGELLQQKVLLEQFRNPSDYHSFVKSNPAKEHSFEM